MADDDLKLRWHVGPQGPGLTVSLGGVEETYFAQAPVRERGGPPNPEKKQTLFERAFNYTKTVNLQDRFLNLLGLLSVARTDGALLSARGITTPDTNGSIPLPDVSCCGFGERADLQHEILTHFKKGDRPVVSIIGREPSWRVALLVPASAITFDKGALEALCERLAAPSPPPGRARESEPVAVAAHLSAASKVAPATERGRDHEDRAGGLAVFEKKIEEALLAAPLLARALAKRFCWDDEVRLEDRGAELLDKSAKDVAIAIADAIEMIDRERNVGTDRGGHAAADRDRRAAADLLWRFLPLAGDWRDMVEKARAAVRDGVAIELHLRTETVAEIIMAGVDATPCLWAPEDHMPQGARHVPLPAAAHAPLLDPKGERLAEAVEAVFINIYEEPSHELWGQVKKRFPRFRDFEIGATAEMDHRARRGEPFYMLIIDEDLDPHEERDRDHTWRVVQRSIGKALPHLRLVRLTGGAPELSNEYPLAPPIRDVRDRR